VAEKVRFDESDMRAAITTDTRVNPVEENQKRMAGQMDELYTIAAEAKKEVRVANERISALDEYDLQENVIVNFKLNSACFRPRPNRISTLWQRKPSMPSGT
jgi:hypothetical protein